LLNYLVDIVNTYCDDLIKWLADSETGRDIIFQNILFKVLNEFETIPITSCSCERTFSKLSFIKTKLSSTMQQDCLDVLLTIIVLNSSLPTI